MVSVETGNIHIRGVFATKDYHIWGYRVSSIVYGNSDVGRFPVLSIIIRGVVAVGLLDLIYNLSIKRGLRVDFLPPHGFKLTG